MCADGDIVTLSYITCDYLSNILRLWKSSQIVTMCRAEITAVGPWLSLFVSL